MHMKQHPDYFYNPVVVVDTIALNQIYKRSLCDLHVLDRSPT